MNIFYPILKKVVGIYLRFCYKRIYSNKFNELPDNTPIMLACNHNNAFSDALFVGSYLSDLDMKTLKKTTILWSSVTKPLEKINVLLFSQREIVLQRKD